MIIGLQKKKIVEAEFKCTVFEVWLVVLPFAAIACLYGVSPNSFGYSEGFVLLSFLVGGSRILFVLDLGFSSLYMQKKNWKEAV